jgi:twitching motility two-component system response regulator PilH
MSTEQAQQTSSLSPLHLLEVMVVDDDEFYRQLLTGILGDKGFHVTTAEDGETAMLKLRQRLANLILMDYQMPGIDGIETLRQIKSDAQLRDATVIMLTSTSHMDVVQHCIDAGAVDFIVKPSDPETILAKVIMHFFQI